MGIRHPADGRCHGPDALAACQLDHAAAGTAHHVLLGPGFLHPCLENASQTVPQHGHAGEPEYPGSLSLQRFRHFLSRFF